MISNEEEARAFVGARCSPGALSQLEKFAKRLATENKRQNLVSTSSLDRIWTRHIADSAQLLDFAPPECGLWFDLGSGAGFPGLVIAIMRPEFPVKLVESRQLRARWLQHCLDEAHGSNAEVIDRRLQIVPTASASVITARAFAPLQKLIALARRFSTSDTVWLLPKGRSAAQEVAQLSPPVRRLFHVEPSATGADSGIVVGRVEEALQP